MIISKLNTIKCGLFSSIIYLLPLVMQAQEIKKTVWKAEMGIMGIWISNEVMLTEKFTLRNEAGVEITNWTINDRFMRPGDKAHIMPFVLTAEPRFYFAGLDNEQSWYLSLKTSYHPPVSLISNTIQSDISVVPTIAARYKIGEHFTYELGGGMGYMYIFERKNTGRSEIGSGWAFNIVLRIAYVF